MRSLRIVWNMYRAAAALWWLDSALVVFTAGLFTIPALLSREFFNALTHTADFHLSLYAIVALLVSSELVRIGAQFASNLVRATHRYRLNSPLRERLISAICTEAGVALPSTGDMITRLRDDVDETVGFLTGLCSLSGQFAYSLIAIAVMVSINAQVTVITLSCAGLVVVLVRVGSAGLRRYRVASREASAQVSELLGEVFGAVQAVQVAGAEGHICAHLASLNNARRATVVRESRYGSILGAVSAYATTVGSAAMLLLAAHSMRNGSFTVGDFALFNYFLGYMAGFPGSVAEVITRYNQMSVSIDRLGKLLSEPGDLPELADSADGNDRRVADNQTPAPFESLRVVDVSYRYPNSSNGIDGVGFTAPRGSVTVIVGPIGSGKTTLLKCLLGIFEMNRGGIYWNGTDVEPGGFLIPPRVAYAPQAGQLFSASLADNVLLGLPAERLISSRIAYRSVLEHDLEGMPNGWNTQIGARGVRLSGGQKQRVLAARMLARDAELVVIDDLSSALDSDVEAQLWDRLFADTDKTFIVASNRPAVLGRADQVIVMNKGKVVAQGSPSDLESDEDWLIEARH